MIPITLYHTDDDYAIAKSNGINPSTFRERMRRNWDKERAMTKPVNNRAKWLKVAAQNGIGKGTFDNRVYGCGWTYEDAATKPLGNGYYTELLKQAHKKGNMIAYSTLYQRIERGMSEEKAISMPPQTTNKHTGKSVVDRMLEVEVQSPHSSWF